MTSRFQLTVALGSGERGAAWNALIAKLSKRFKVEPTEVVRIALRTLDRVKKEDAVTDDKDPD